MGDAFNAILKDNNEPNDVIQAKRRVFEAINKLLRILEMICTDPETIPYMKSSVSSKIFPD